MNYKIVLTIIKNTFIYWSEDNVARLAAALSYYTAFSIAPLLIICIAICSLVFEQAAIQGHIIREISALIGFDSAKQIQTMIISASNHGSGVIATSISIVTILFGTTGLFWELQDGLNNIWRVKPKPGSGWLLLIKKRLFSFTIVLAVSFLLLVSLILSAILTLLSGYVTNILPMMGEILNFVISLGIITLLFAMIFKILPDIDIQWKQVWLGAFITALLFNLGKFLLALYLSKSSVSSIYGAAGSFVVILIWVYYSAQILFIGAEFTKAYTNARHHKIVPSAGAIFVNTNKSSDV